MDEKLKKACEDVVKNEFPEFIQILERTLDFKRWGFKRVFSGVGKYAPIVVYASEACQVMFAWELPDIRDGIVKIHVSYGRLHAPYDEYVITLKGQKCYCWHDVEKVLYFLDGLSATQAVKNKFKLPKVMEQFRESSVNKGWTQPEYMAKMHATIWEHYGQRLFQLFDLRQPLSWDRFTQFVAEYQKIRQEFSLQGYPSPDQIC